MRSLLVLACGLSLAACATPYQSKGFMGGYSHIRMSQNTYRVSFDGNAYTSGETTYRYLLRRCAEITLKSGNTWFIPLRFGSGSTPVFFSSTNCHGANCTTTGVVGGKPKMWAWVLSKIDPLVLTRNDPSSDRGSWPGFAAGLRETRHGGGSGVGL